jgi:glycosyltransferase involved in cell wall biosynthesis
LILVRALPFHGLGGMETSTWDLARALVRRGCAVRLLTTACAGRGDGVIEGVDTRFLAAPAGAYSPAWSRESVRAYEDQAGWADVVLSVSAAGFALAAHLAGRRPRPALVMQAHGTSWLELTSKLQSANPIHWLKAIANLRGLVWDRAYRHFDAVIAIGPAVSADMARWPTRALIGGASVHEISNGVDEAFFAFSQPARDRVRAALGIGAEDAVMVTTARLHAQKGVAQALAAFAEVQRRIPAAHHVIVGDGPERVVLQDRARALGVASRVHFIGAVGRAEVAAHLSAGDVFVFTTLRQEGLPLNLLEAFAAGLPAVLSAHINAAHYPAVSVDHQDARDVAGAIVGLLQAPRQARASTLPRRHSLAVAAAEYERTFRTLAAAGR